MYLKYNKDNERGESGGDDFKLQDFSLEII